MNHECRLPQIQYLPLSDLEEKRDVMLVTSGPSWYAVQDKLRLNIVSEFRPTRADEAHWQSAEVKGDVVYAVSGGLAVDAAKYLAFKHHLPLVCIPTALSVEAFLTGTSGVRQKGCVSYVESTTPDQLLIDFEVIRSAPHFIRAVGICDALSIATALWDWRFADKNHKNPPEMAYTSNPGKIAEGILDDTLDCAEGAGRGDKVGLKQLLNCMACSVQLCNQLGHYRPQKGSEHYFAYAVENVLGTGLPYSDLVGSGIIIMAVLQEQNIETLRKALIACHVSLNNIPHSIIETSLRGLPAYARKHDLPYSLAHELTQNHLAYLSILD